MNETFNCQSCGACCQALPDYKGDVYVRLWDEDEQRLTPIQKHLYTKQISPVSNWGAIHGIKLEKGRCAALDGKVGSCVSCEIYDNRPNICRQFEKGSESCMLAREEAGLGEFSVSTQ